MDNFLIKQDGSFRAHMGEVILKAQKVGETEGWKFTAVASTPDKDREGETLLQKGLNFDPFIDSGEFNWNHQNHVIVGVPVGKKAWFENNHWMCEGMIVKGLPIAEKFLTDQVVQQHNTMKKAGLQKGLCCSVEGKVTERSDCGKYVKKADIYNIALTFRPVNPNCSLTLLAKSLDKSVEIAYEDEFIKSLGVEGAKPFTKESFGDPATPKKNVGRRLVKHLVEKGYTEDEAMKHVSIFMKSKILGIGSK